MMSEWGLIAVLLSGIPLAAAWWANRRTSLIHALVWATAAWLAWVGSAATGTVTVRYLALCLTACAGVAVLGARRPGAGAWHGVVGGLLAVLLIPLVQDYLSDSSRLTDPIWMSFLGITLAVGILNYLPTRLWLSSITFLIVCFSELFDLRSGPRPRGHLVPIAWAAGALWWAWGMIRMYRAEDEPVDRLWRDFRDRFGFVWAQRLRDQFNSGAQHNNLDVELTWRGLRGQAGSALDERQLAASRELLLALTQRFGRP